MRPIETAAATVALLAGFAVAIGSTRLVTHALLQTMIAGLGGWVVGSIIGAALWLRSPAPEATVLAVKWGPRQVLLAFVAVILISSAVHGVFALANLIHPSLGSWRHLLVGGGTSLFGAFGFALGAGFGEPLR